MSTSHFMIDWNVVSWMPLASLPMKLGWNNTSGQRNRSLPTVITLPSGSSYVFSFSELSAAAFISVSKSSATYESFSFTSRTISRPAVAAVHHDARRAAARVERQHELDRHVHRRHVERLEHDLRHALAVRLRVERRLRQQHRVLLRRHTELVVERVVPDLLHVVPVRHDAVLDRVLQRQDTTLALRLAH